MLLFALRTSPLAPGAEPAVLRRRECGLVASEGAASGWLSASIGYAAHTLRDALTPLPLPGADEALGSI